MRTIIRKIKYYFDIAKQKGFTYIVVSSLLNKVIVLASTIALNRLLSQTDYGYFSYAYNIVSMVMVISSLGVDVSLLQFCCENRSDAEKKKQV
jgi:O-antigen/teichoic acid export membrane protein